MDLTPPAGPDDSADPRGLDPATAALLDAVNPADPNDQPAGGNSAPPAGSSPPPKPYSGEPMIEVEDVVREDTGTVAAGDGPAFQAVVRQSALDAVRAHGEESPDVEVCGVLVGTVYQNDSAGIVYVDAVVRGQHATGRNSAVTFTAETWAYIDREMDEKHPGKRIVGWYHTHPGFGIFLSEMDRFIQRHFFNAPWQTALVYDPKSRERGMFAWRAGETMRVEFMVDDGSGPQAAGSVPAGQDGPARGSAAEVSLLPPGSGAELTNRMEAIERRQQSLLVGLAVTVVVAVVWPLLVPMVMPLLTRPSGPKPAAPPPLVLPPELPSEAPAKPLGPPPPAGAAAEPLPR